MEENVLKMRSAKWFIKIHIYIEQTVIHIHNLFYLLKYKFFIRILYNLWVTKQDQLLLGEGVNISTFQEAAGLPLPIVKRYFKTVNKGLDR